MFYRPLARHVGSGPAYHQTDSDNAYHWHPDGEVLYLKHDVW